MGDENGTLHDPAADAVVDAASDTNQQPQPTDTIQQAYTANGVDPSVNPNVDGVTKKLNLLITYPQRRPPQGWDFGVVFPSDLALKAQVEKIALVLTEEQEKDKFEELVAERNKNRKEIMSVLKHAGFAMSQILSGDRMKIIVRFALPEDVMKHKAEHYEFRLQLKEEYGGGYIPYKKERDHCYINADFGKPDPMAAVTEAQGQEGGDSRGEAPKTDKVEPYFTSYECVQITRIVLEADDYEGCDFNLTQMKYDGKVEQFLAFHDPEKQEELIKAAVFSKWWNPLWKPPFRQLQDYLGSQLGLYFAFVAAMNMSLWLVALCGIPVYVVFVMKYNDGVVSALNIAYCIVIAVWSVVFLEIWKRRNAQLNAEWGTVHMDFDVVDRTRPEYTGVLTPGFYFQRGFVKLTDLQNKKFAELGLDPAAMTDEERLDKCRELNIAVNVHYPTKNRIQTQFISGALQLFFIAIAIVIQIVLIMYRDDIITALGDIPVAAMVPGIINGVVIVILDTIWGVISLKITNKENHRSEEDYINSLVYKRFGFQFFSNYTSLIYLAFVRPFLHAERVDNCKVGWLEATPTCMSDLSFQLLTLLATRVTISQAIEIILPAVITGLKKFMTWLKVRKVANAQDGQVSSESDQDIQQDIQVNQGSVAPKAEGDADEPARTETESKKKKKKKSKKDKKKTIMSRYHAEVILAPFTNIINEYNEIVLLYGYLSLFAVAFPLAPVLVLFNNLVEVRSDAYKILRFNQMPYAYPADTIGAWFVVLEVLGYLSVLSNVALLVYTSDSLGFLFSGVTDTARAVAFFLLENAIIALKLLIEAAIPDVPARVQKRLARQEYDVAFSFGEGMKKHYNAQQVLKIDHESIERMQAELDDFDQASDIDP